MLSRFFSLMSYAKEEDIINILKSKERYLDFACYAYHDKDDNENHYHILIQLKNPRKQEQILKWFEGLTDDEGKECNTFSEITKSTEDSFYYLTHSNEVKEVENEEDN